MSKHPLQFLEIPRKDPAKEDAEERIKHFDEIYESYDGASAAAHAGASVRKTGFVRARVRSMTVSVQ